MPCIRRFRPTTTLAAMPTHPRWRQQRARNTHHHFIVAQEQPPPSPALGEHLAGLRPSNIQRTGSGSPSATPVRPHSFLARGSSRALFTHADAADILSFGTTFCRQTLRSTWQRLHPVSPRNNQTGTAATAATSNGYAPPTPFQLGGHRLTRSERPLRCIKVGRTTFSASGRSYCFLTGRNSLSLRSR